jgi:1-aminocyclopropane-1-carboxylate deaminase/D-cysteine desulfhydrase-like pyridoxal-dependent ACC family enzyme
MQLFEMGEAPKFLYFANGSRGTHSGLALGKMMYDAPYQIEGIAVSGGGTDKTARAVGIVKAAADVLGFASAIGEKDFLNDEGYVGPGYGIVTPAGLEAIHLFASCEGIFLDPVYTAKAAAGMIGHIRRGVIDPDTTIIFLHTGGTPGLFARVDDLALKSL